MSQAKSSPIPRLVAHALTIAVSIGAVTNGLSEPVITAPVRDLSMALITLLAVGWWLAQIMGRTGPRWFLKAPRPLSWIDLLGVAWVAAVTTAWATNNLANRRSMVGAWYDGLALLTVLMVTDLIRRGLPRRWLTDGLLLIGAGWLLVGLWQFVTWLSDWLQTRGSGLPFLPVRPIGLLGNPNSFATALLAVLFLSASRAFGPKRAIMRVAWLIYAGVSLLLLILTQSRGGWVGAAAGLAAGVVLLIYLSGLWRRVSPRQIAIIVGACLVIGALLTVFVLLPLYRATGRSDNRPDIYRIALQAFGAQPLTGYGPDSFGLQLLENQSIPPQPAHLHAHEIILHIAAELGLPGLLAALLSCVIGLRLYWRNLSSAAVADRPLLIGLGTACMAIAAHGLFDVTAAQPSLFMLDVGLFAAAIAPGLGLADKPATLAGHRSRYLLRGGVSLISAGLSLFVVIGGWFGALAYDPYWAGLQAIAAQPFPAGWVAAQPLFETAVSRDPLSPVAAAEAGYVDGLLATLHADPALQTRAIGYYEQALALEPPNAVNWLNLAILYGQNGRAADASHAAQQVIRYAADDALLLINGGIVLEQTGHSTAASTAYTRALTLAPDLASQPLWQTTALRRAVIAQVAVILTPTQKLLNLIASGDSAAATQQAASERAISWGSTQPYLDSALLLIRTHGDLTLADHDLKAARMNFDVYNDWPWFHYVQAELDAARGDQPGHDRELALIAHNPGHDLDGSSILGGNVAAPAYFMKDLPRHLLPGIWYPAVPGDLLPLLAPTP